MSLDIMYDTANMQFKRNTHNADGEYRKEMEEVWDKIPNTFSGIVHYLDSNEWLSLGQILSEIFDYSKTYPFENSSMLAAQPKLILEILIMLANFDMIQMRK